MDFKHVQLIQFTSSEFSCTPLWFPNVKIFYFGFRTKGKKKTTTTDKQWKGDNLVKGENMIFSLDFLHYSGVYRHQSSRCCTLPFFLYKRKTWKGKMIKNMLKRRKESDTYLAADSRLRWSPQIAMKVDKECSFQPALRPSSVGVALFPSF